MPVTKDLELPIERIVITGPAVDALENRKECDDGPTEEQVTDDARKFIEENPLFIKGWITDEFAAGRMTPICYDPSTGKPWNSPQEES